MVLSDVKRRHNRSVRQVIESRLKRFGSRAPRRWVAFERDCFLRIQNPEFRSKKNSDVAWLRRIYFLMIERKANALF